MSAFYLSNWSREINARHQTQLTLVKRILSAHVPDRLVVAFSSACKARPERSPIFDLVLLGDDQSFGRYLS